MRQILPEEEVRISSVNGAVLLSGEVSSLSAADDAARLAARFATEEAGVINQLKVNAPNQVSLRVRIAEVSREVVKELGFNWESVASQEGYGFVLGTGRDVIPTDENFFLRATQDALGLSLSRGGLNLALLIDALETEGLVSVLAEPNLTAVSGETASFLAGGEFPIPVALKDDKVTIEFKKFGVSLSFTPTILGKDRINIRVRPEVSQLSTTGAVTANNFNIPALTTRRAETTVEMGSGQSFAIGGLLQNNVNHDIRRFPGLGDVPVLGTLFRSNSFQRDETELVIIVTPYIVKPVDSPKMALPNDGLVMPNDTERLIMGQTHRPQLQDSKPTPKTPGGQGLYGPAGFELE
jgi:pilus assembly protein CpaC